MNNISGRRTGLSNCQREVFSYVFPNRVEGRLGAMRESAFCQATDCQDIQPSRNFHRIALMTKSLRFPILEQNQVMQYFESHCDIGRAVASSWGEQKSAPSPGRRLVGRGDQREKNVRRKNTTPGLRSDRAISGTVVTHSVAFFCFSNNQDMLSLRLVSEAAVSLSPN
jgi:hypothetical protein